MAVLYAFAVVRWYK